MSATPLFLIVLRMSLYAGWTALVVMLVRLVLHCGPKRLSYLLWGVVGFRMVCPVSFSGAVSLMPSFSNVVSPQVIMGSHRQTSALFAEPAATAPLPQALASMERGGTGGFWLEIGAWIWLSVAVVLMLWNVVAYLRLRRKMSTAVLEQENIFSSDPGFPPPLSSALSVPGFIFQPDFRRSSGSIFSATKQFICSEKTTGSKWRRCWRYLCTGLIHCSGFPIV